MLSGWLRTLRGARRSSVAMATGAARHAADTIPRRMAALCLLLGTAPAPAVALAGALPQASPVPVQVEHLMATRAVRSLAWSPDGRHLVFAVVRADETANAWRSDLYLATPDADPPQPKQRLTHDPANDDTPRWSPDGRSLAFLSGRGDTTQVWLLDVAGGGEARRVTHAPEGADDFAWMPDGRHIVYSSVDPIDPARRKAREDERDAEPREKDFAYRHLHVVDVDTGRSARLTRGPLHVAEIAVSPDGAWIAFTAAPTPMRRDEEKTEVYRIPAQGGVPERLTRNTMDETDLSWSPDGIHVVFTLTVAGGKTIYPGVRHLFALRVTDAGADPEPVPLTTSWERGVVQASPCYVWAGDDRLEVLLQDGMRDFVATLRLRRGGRGRGAALQVRDLTETWRPEGWVSALAAPPRNTGPGAARGARADARAWVMDDPVHPPEVYVAARPRDYARARRLTQVNAAAARLQMARAEAITTPGAGGVPVEGLLFTPRDGTPPFPLVVVIHGGPLSTERWAWKMSWTRYPHLLAQRGVATFMPNYRGSYGYGEAWARDIVGHYYENDVQDILRGVDALVERGVADPERLATMGWSNGGILSAWITTETDRFKAACLGAADVNWISDYGTSEIGPTFDQAYFLKPPYDDPQHYVDKSPIFRVRNVRTPSLIFHGERDFNVPLNQGWEWFRLLRENGVPVEFVTVPRASHGIREVKNQRVKVERELAWLEKYGIGGSDADAILAALPREGARQVNGLYGRLVDGALVPEMVSVLGDTLEVAGTRRFVHGVDIGLFEVTNAQYASYLAANPRAEVPRAGAYDAGIEPLDAGTRRPHAGYENHPVVGVDLEAARAYCAWLSRVTGETYRLPTPAEWRLAARGERHEAGAFPGGDAPPPANSAETWAHAERWAAAEFWTTPAGRDLLARRVPTRPVGSYAPGPNGLYDLAGNVAEWCAEPGAAAGLLYGGSYASWKPELRIDAPVDHGPAGFRVVRPHGTAAPARRAAR